VRKMSSSRVIGAGVLLGLAGPGLAACDSDQGVEQDTQFQCAIERNGVEEAVDCDDVNDNDGSTYVGGAYYPVFIHSYPAGGTIYSPGQRLPSDASRHRIGYKDSAGRQQWGLPPSGKVANGQTAKVNVVGKGGAPVKAGGGGGVGGKAGSAGG
jgi:hypothetical protein